MKRHPVNVCAECREMQRNGIKLPFLADILDTVVSHSVRKFVISHNWDFPCHGPTFPRWSSRVHFGPLFGPHFPWIEGFRGRVYEGRCVFVLFRWWSELFIFNYNEAENASLSHTTFPLGSFGSPVQSAKEVEFIIYSEPLTHRSALVLKAAFISPDCWLQKVYSLRQRWSNVLSGGSDSTE